MAAVYVFIGGGLGSLMRYGISLLMKGLVRLDFPFATFLSNILACLILGLLVYVLQIRSNAPAWLDQLLIIGFCGGFSTFSTFSHETVELMDRGHYAVAIVNIALSLIVGVSLIFMMRYFRS